MESVAPTLQEKGIMTFLSIASIEGLKSRMDEDNEMFVYEENDGVIGFIELKEGCHIAMLFVSPCSQKKGVGQSLLAAVLLYAKSNVITVSTSLTMELRFNN